MENHEVGGRDLGDIERLCAKVATAAGQSGGIGISPGQVQAALNGLLILMTLKPSALKHQDNWDDHEGRSRPLSDLAPVIRDEVPGNVSERTIERIMGRLHRAGIRTIGQLVSRSPWDVEHGQVNLGQFDFRILEAALALRKLRFMGSGTPG